MINIEQVHKTVSYDSFEILGIQINPKAIGENYGQGLILLKCSEKPLENKTIQLSFTKEELDRWSDDDSVIVHLIAQKLGVNLV